jgi:8-oxo-dGTP pyrophosphatase MutT (NUDIX family)
MITHLKNLGLPQSIESFTDSDTEKNKLLQWSGAVNFLFVRDHILLIKRSESMQSHKGQLSFIGGHRKAQEVDPILTAKREFIEETGLTDHLLTVIGLTEPVFTSYNQLIFPVLSYVDLNPTQFLTSLRSNGEWDEALMFPYQQLRDHSLWTQGEGVMSSTEPSSILFYPLIPESYQAKSGQTKNSHLLWGATAKMIWKFFKKYDQDVKSFTSK